MQAACLEDGAQALGGLATHLGLIGRPGSAGGQGHRDPMAVQMPQQACRPGHQPGILPPAGQEGARISTLIAVVPSSQGTRDAPDCGDGDGHRHMPWLRQGNNRRAAPGISLASCLLHCRVIYFMLH